MMVTPYHHARDHHLNMHHARYKKEEEEKLIQERSRPPITPVTMVVHHHHGRDQGRDHLQESLSFFLFFPCVHHPRDQFFKAWSRPWSMPCLLLCFVFVFQMFLKVVMCYNHLNISIYACIYIVQRSFINYMYFGVSAMRVFLSKLYLKFRFWIWMVFLSGVTSLELGIRYSITCLSVRFRTIGLKLKLDLIECACCLKIPWCSCQLAVARSWLMREEKRTAGADSGTGRFCPVV